MGKKRKGSNITTKADTLMLIVKELKTEVTNLGRLQEQKCDRDVV